MKKYNVKITDEAVRDLDDIYDYICNKLLSPQNAMGQYDRIVEAILKLDINPERNRVIDIPDISDLNLRMLCVDNYTVFYTIKQDDVFVTDIIYGACDYKTKLKGLEVKDK